MFVKPRTALEHANHVLNLICLRILPAEGLRTKDLVLPHRLVPINQVVVVDAVAPAAAPASSALLDGAEAKAAC